MESLTRAFTVQIPRPLSLVFPSRETEREFQNRFARDALPRYRVVIPLVIFMWAFFGVLDHRVFSADKLDFARVLRYAVILPILLAAFAFAFTSRELFAKHWQRVLAIGYGSMMLGMLVLTQMGDPREHNHGATAISLVMMGGYTLVMLRFVYALAISAAASVAAGILFSTRFNYEKMVWDTMDTGMVWILMANVIGGVACYELEKFRRYKFIQELVIEKERERAEALLSNTLPAAIIERLKAGEVRPVDAYSEVTVVFADLVGFTKAAASLSPRQLVDRLDDLFSEFDGIADHYGLEKIKTIGDEYMIVAGVPDFREDHAATAASLALDMLATVKMRQEHSSDAFEVRIGMHTGPVVAGIIGERQLHYDVWGDTVNIASRMQSHGVPGQIQVSDTTQRRLSEAFNLEPRGELDLKGRGTMKTYLLTGRRVPQIDPTGGYRDYIDAEQSNPDHTDVDGHAGRLTTERDSIG